jgi:ELWxxDGT repeat protein
MRRLPLLAVVLACASAAAAGLGTPYRVANINAQPLPPLLGSGSIPSAIGDDVYFESWGGLWRTDGTSQGTYFVLPGPLGFPLSFGGKFLYTTLVGSQPQTWVTDGTTPGTLQIGDGALVSAGVCGDSSCYSSYGTALRVTDGTPAGTRVLAYTATEEPGSGNLTLDFATVGKQLYFNAYDDAHGQCADLGNSVITCGELWTSDGTAAGTCLAVDLIPGPYPSGPRRLFAADGKLYFDAIAAPSVDPSHPRCAYVSDGTAAGTFRLVDYCANKSEPIDFFTVGGRTYFHVSPHLYVTDGTVAGTRRISDVIGLPENEYVSDIAAARDRLVLRVFRNGRTEAWASDRDYGGAAFLQTLPSGGLLGTSRTGDVLFYTRDDNGSDLLISDGTVAGTRTLLRVPSAYGFDGLVSTSVYDFFTTIASTPATLWRTDGTPEGTRVIDNSTPRDGSATPSKLTSTGDQLFFLASSGTGERGLYRSTADPLELRRLLDCGKCSNLRAKSGRLYFDNDSVLWTSDGTVSGTKPFADWLQTDVKPLSLPMLVGGRRLFAGARGSDRALYAIEGNSVAVVKALPSNGGVVTYDVIGERLVFNWGAELWSSDGTGAGTKAIAADVKVGGPLVPAGNRAFALSDDPTPRVWSTDGSAEGTTSAAVARGRNVHAARNGVLLYTDSDTGKLWRTDGTPAGTFLIPTTAGETFRYAIDAGPHIALVTNEIANEGVEVWKSDGTIDGTRLLLTLTNRFYDVTPPFLAGDGQAYLALRTTANVVRLVNLSGGADREAPFPRIEPQVDDYYEPTRLTVVPAAGALFFSASSIAHGSELWTMPLDAVSSARLPEIRAANGTLVDLAGGRRAMVFRVEMVGDEFVPATVSFTTTDGSAVAGRDYTPSTGTLRFTSYETTKAVVVPLTPGASGTLWLTLSNAQGAEITRAVAAGTTVESSRRRTTRR